MVMPDLLTEVKHHLPVVNVVLENKSFGFIGHEKLQAGQAPYGIDLVGADWAKVAESMGAIGFTATNLAELKNAMAKIKQLEANGNDLPIVLDAKILDIDPIDTNVVMTDEAVFGADVVADYRQTYDISAADQPAFSELLRAENE